MTLSAHASIYHACYLFGTYLLFFGIFQAFGPRFWRGNSVARGGGSRGKGEGGSSGSGCGSKSKIRVAEAYGGGRGVSKGVKYSRGVRGGPPAGRGRVGHGGL
jgi:hypothetical protein